LNRYNKSGIPVKIQRNTIQADLKPATSLITI